MHFPDITLLITHYNRSSSLERLLAAMQRTQCSFGEIIVSDDGSKPEYQEQLEGYTAGISIQTGRNAGKPRAGQQYQ